MKKLFLVIASAFITALALTSCETDPASSKWLKYTVWTANPVGKELSDELSSPKTITGGSISIKFSGTGYIMLYDLSTNDPEKGVNAMFAGKVSSDLFPDYSYPDLYFPFQYKNNDQEEMMTSIGIISSDLKTIHFDTFTISYMNPSGAVIIKDLDFTR